MYSLYGWGTFKLLYKMSFGWWGGAGTFLMEHKGTFRKSGNFNVPFLSERKVQKVPWYFSKFALDTHHPPLFGRKFEEILKKC